jgi:hypothetical protein
MGLKGLVDQTGHAHPARYPLLAAFDLCLKCSHLFNILDARGAISVTERVGVIARIRALAVGVAKAYADQQKTEAESAPLNKDDGARESEGRREPEQLAASRSQSALQESSPAMRDGTR